MLQALHDTTQAAGGRMSDKYKAEILATLLALFSTAQVCNGVLLHSLLTFLVDLVADRQLDVQLTQAERE